MVKYPLPLCPDCKKRKWTIVDWENKKAYVDFDKAKPEFIPEKTQIKSLICTNCGHRDDSFQKPTR